MLSVRVNTSAMRARLARTLRAAPRGREAGARVLAGELVRNLAAFSPTDTNRYIRGWLLAGQMAGVYRGPIPALRKTKYHDAYLETIEKHIARVRSRLREARENLERFYPGGPPKKPTTRTYARLVRKIEKLEAELAKALEMLETARRDPHVIVIGGGKVFRDPETGLYTQAFSRKSKPSLRTKVYGGRGQIMNRAGTTLIYLHNLEAHATLVESRNKTLRNASSAARAAGIRPASKAFLAEIRKAGGAARSATVSASSSR